MRLTLRRVLLLFAVLALVLGGSRSRELSAAQSTALPVEFNRDMRPILSNACFGCHGPNESARQAALRLDLQAGPFEDRGRYGGPVIVRGNAADSLLFHRITDEDARTRMPRGGGALSDDEIATIRRWIDQGAAWQTHWAFVPPERPPAHRSLTASGRAIRSTISCSPGSSGTG